MCIAFLVPSAFQHTWKEVVENRFNVNALESVVLCEVLCLFHESFEVSCGYRIQLGLDICFSALGTDVGQGESVEGFPTEPVAINNSPFRA